MSPVLQTPSTCLPLQLIDNQNAVTMLAAYCVMYHCKVLNYLLLCLSFAERL